MNQNTYLFLLFLFQFSHSVLTDNFGSIKKIFNCCRQKQNSTNDSQEFDDFKNDINMEDQNQLLQFRHISSENFQSLNTINSQNNSINDGNQIFYSAKSNLQQQTIKNTDNNNLEQFNLLASGNKSSGFQTAKEDSIFQNKTQREQINQNLSLQTLAEQFILINKIPNECDIDLSLYKKLKQENIILGKGGFGTVFQYEGFAYKVCNNNQEIQSHKYAINEYKYMKKYELINRNLFMNNISCIVSVDNNQTYFIIKQPIMGDNLNYQNDIEYGGKQFFQIKEISDNIDLRYSLYMRMFEQLKVMHENNDLHMDIKPSNIITNIKLEKFLVDHKLDIKTLELNLVDFGLVESPREISFRGTLNFMHPLYAHQLQQNSTQQLDIYALALSIAIIEMYKLEKDIDYLFQDYSNHKIKKIIQQKKQMQLSFNRQELMDTIQKQLQDYQNKIIILLCSKQYDNIQNLSEEEKSNIVTQIQKNNCSKCFACVISQAIQIDQSKIPSIDAIQKDIKNLIQYKKLYLYI